jgi:hypothetical protein
MKFEKVKIKVCTSSLLRRVSSSCAQSGQKEFFNLWLSVSSVVLSGLPDIPLWNHLI